MFLRRAHFVSSWSPSPALLTTCSTSDSLGSGSGYTFSSVAQQLSYIVWQFFVTCFLQKT